MTKEQFVVGVANYKMEKELTCEECGGTGFVTQGQYDDIYEVRCPFCNHRTDDDMDDDS